jgi:hypothetical protein
VMGELPIVTTTGSAVGIGAAFGDPGVVKIGLPKS